VSVYICIVICRYKSYFIKSHSKYNKENKHDEIIQMSTED